MELQENELFFAVLTSTALFILLFAFFIMFFAVYRRRQIEHKIKEERITQRFGEELLRAQLELNEQLLQRVSEEIHDNFGQAVISAKMQLDVSNETNFSDQKQVVDEILTRSLADLRDLSRTLNGNYIQKEGLNSALEREVRLINHAGKIKCELSEDIPESHFSDDVQIVIFRCIQECLSNAIKHAQANLIRISSTISDGIIQISITDDGKGMPKDWESQKKGLGMHNLQNRLDLIGGRVEINSMEGKGTRIGMIVPVKTEKEIFTSGYKSM